MPSLKDIKTQINSVVSTKKITTAMKMVAASKLRRSQEKAVAARPYSSRLEEMLSSLASSAASGEGIIKLLTGTGNDKSYMVVPVSADRGLCGGFNSSINRETFKLVKSLEKDGKNVQLMPVGKKSRDFFIRVMKDQIVESFIDLNLSNTGYESALQVSNKLQDLYFDGKLSKEETIKKIKQNTRNYAKRQITWFKKYNNALTFNIDDNIDELLNKLLKNE